MQLHRRSNELEHASASLETTQTFFDSVSNVEGSISGKSFKNTGNRNSMKGTMTNTRKGTSRKRSAHVRSSCTEKSTPEIIIQPDKKSVPKWKLSGLTSFGAVSLPVHRFSKAFTCLALTLRLSLLVRT